MKKNLKSVKRSVAKLERLAARMKKKAPKKSARFGATSGVVDELHRKGSGAALVAIERSPNTGAVIGVHDRWTMLTTADGTPKATRDQRKQMRAHHYLGAIVVRFQKGAVHGQLAQLEWRPTDDPAAAWTQISAKRLRHMLEPTKVEAEPPTRETIAGELRHLLFGTVRDIRRGHVREPIVSAQLLERLAAALKAIE